MPTQTKALNRPSPHDTTAERVLLRGLMTDADDVFPALEAMGFDATDLYHHSHRLVYAAILRGLFSGSGRCDAVALYRDLEERGELAELGVRPGLWIADVWTLPPWFPGVQGWWQDGYECPGITLYVAAPVAAAAKVRHLARRRWAIHLGRALIADAESGHLCPGDERLAALAR